MGSSLYQQSEWAIVVHGGAGAVRVKAFLRKKQAAYMDAIQHALDTGSYILDNGRQQSRCH